ncbi:hypothetical protein CBR_g30423 [Chara braunii]|uniref:Band 7 domain-containing protein n=1 Tax=Chara braunii TaxID=69332 RepID=A0A388LCL1_CHABU|nr:hypothetical protein CBR_g30423 [Chara braunii]|eukprot:GBG80057.1 hypothetical protein CBR_g30423 [Chara braunii]
MGNVHGCLCIVCIGQSEVGLIEKWGKYVRPAPPGLHVINYCEGEWLKGTLSMRIQQLEVKCLTKTKDNVFVHVVCSIQYRVLQDNVDDAFYELQNPKEQIQAYVFDVVRASVPKMNLDEVFEQKDDIARIVAEELDKVMGNYGYCIVQTLITDVEPDETVRKAMNEINAANRMRMAVGEKAEAEKFLQVKRAEADAESKYLSGVGIARQRQAIVEGLRESVLAFSHNVPGATPKDVMDMVLLTQYFDTMKDIGGCSKSTTVFIPHGPGSVNDVATQIRNGLLQGQSGKDSGWYFHPTVHEGGGEDGRRPEGKKGEERGQEEGRTGGAGGQLEEDRRRDGQREGDNKEGRRGEVEGGGRGKRRKMKHHCRGREGSTVGSGDDEMEKRILEEDVIKRQAMEDEQRMEWKLAVMREKKRRVDAAAEAAEELEEVKKIEEQLAAQTEIPKQMQVIARNVARLARIQAEQYDFSRSHHIVVRSIRLGFRDFARELVGAVGAEVGYRLDKTERFCVGAIEGVKAAAPKEEEPRPPGAMLHLKEHECRLPSSSGEARTARLFHVSGVENPLAHCYLSAPAFARLVKKEKLEEQVFVAYVRPTTEPTEEKPMDPVIAKLPIGVVPRPIQHRIEIELGNRTPKGAVYRMSARELEELRKQLDKLLEKGWIRPSSFPFGAPVLFVPKKEGELRMCIDYTGPNAITVKNVEPLPRIDDLLDRVQRAKYFSKIRFEVLEKLREANFKINAKKCDWAKTQVLYLGHVLDGDNVKPEDCKIEAIRDWPTPCTLTELRSFLGLANYYRKFVRNFSTIAAPLRRLLRKETIWKWDKDCTSAMKKLKQALIEYPVLKVADPSLPFVVTTDASQYDIGAVLQQNDGNGYRPVEFMSARMPFEKVAMSTYERELYALRQALEHWKHYLLGRHFKVYSDYETLRWLKTQAKMIPKLTRWAAEIDQYDFELKPVKGKYNVVADALSRRADYFEAIVRYLDIGKDLQQKIREAYAQDHIYSDLLKRVKEAPETEPNYRTTEGLLFEKTNAFYRLCIPNSEEIRSLILGECHDTEGHFGWQKTLANLMRAYTWPGMKNDCVETSIPHNEEEYGTNRWLTMKLNLSSARSSRSGLGLQKCQTKLSSNSASYWDMGSEWKLAFPQTLHVMTIQSSQLRQSQPCN